MRNQALMLALALASCRPGTQAAPEASAGGQVASAQPPASASAPRSSTAPASSPQGGLASGRDAIMAPHLEALHRAGDARRCDEETARVRAALAADRRLSGADLEAEKRDRDPAGKGSMPYPSPGTACALFGIVKALDGAISDRKAGR